MEVRGQEKHRENVPLDPKAPRREAEKRGHSQGEESGWEKQAREEQETGDMRVRRENHPPQDTRSKRSLVEENQKEESYPLHQPQGKVDVRRPKNRRTEVDSEKIANPESGLVDIIPRAPFQMHLAPGNQKDAQTS